MSGPAPTDDQPLIGPDLRAALLAALRAESDRRRAEVAIIDPRLLPELDALIRFATTGGKLLRGSFLCLGFLAVTADLPDAVLRAAAALELLQACALLHDDLIDRSDTRRGRPSVHRAVAAAHDRADDPDHLGVSVALLLGDLALAWADDLLVEAAAEVGRLADVLPQWRAVRTEVLAGQLLDVLVTAHPAADAAGQLTDAELVNLYKTAAYTVTRPLLLGAALAGASADARSSLATYGRAVGLAFQLQDDLLGVFGDPTVTGKPVAGDLVEGKRTVLISLTRQALSTRPELLASLDEGLGTPGASALTDLIAASGAPEAVAGRIDALTAEAVAALGPGSGLRPDPADRLARFARQAAHRAR